MQSYRIAVLDPTAYTQAMCDFAFPKIYSRSFK